MARRSTAPIYRQRYNQSAVVIWVMSGAAIALAVGRRGWRWWSFVRRLRWTWPARTFSSPTLRFTLEELLRHYGYMVTTAARSEAAGLLAHGPFDVVLLDGTLPGMNETDGTPLVQAKLQNVLQHAIEAE